MRGHGSRSLSWTDWRAFERPADAPDAPGLYRFRQPQDDFVVYVGETGSGRVTIAKRLEVLRSVNASEMPYRYPYAAAPALWALRHAGGAPLEVSWAPIEGDRSARYAAWVVELAAFRAKHGRSPLANFGRMPAGYRSSSSYSCDLMHRGALYRGGPTRARDEQHEPGRAPLGPLDPDVHAARWCRGQWSPWGSELPPTTATGILRVRQPARRSLLAVSNGVLRAAATRARKLGAKGTLEYSWLRADDWPEHHGDEILVDLLGAHVLAVGRLPGAG